MKKAIYTIALLVALVSCEEDENLVFEKTADERAAEAIANLKQDLIAPANGWKIKYTPQDGAGSYHVLLDFNEDNKVTIQSDLGADDGAYFKDTISYRIDNSLGLELILENYSFFSFLFELDQATFGAEYEFDFVNKTPDNALVFRSKTDVSTPDVIVFEEADASDESLLGTGVSLNLNTLSEDFDKFTSSVRMIYQNKDLALYISLDALRRTFTVTSASLKSNTQSVQSINFTTPYLLQGNSIIFESPLERTILGNAISISSLQLNTFGETTLSLCAEPMTLHNYTGVTSANDPVLLETSLIDVTGASFTGSDFYFTPLVYIFNNGESMGDQVPLDITGAVEMHMYYGLELQNGDILYGIGFVIQNPDGTVTFALREFTPELTGNNIKFNFAAELSIFGAPTTDTNLLEKVNIYLDPLAQGDNTYIFQLNDGIYEFYNPCSGWSFVLIDANQ